MTLRPFFCFYGGKWRAAPRYPHPRFGIIVEPFAGAAGYALRHHTHGVYLVERDPTIAALWRWLIEVSSDEVRSIPILRMHETVDDLRGVAPEAKSLVGFWLNKGGAQPKRSPSAWMREGIRPKSFWCDDIRERIATQVDAIRHWTLIEGSYESAPNYEATWFVDPPYQHAGQHYRYHAVDYPALAAWTRTRKGNVIVCENEGADWLPFESFATLKSNESSHGGRISREVICKWNAA